MFSKRYEETSNCGLNFSDTLGCASCATFLFLPHFDDLLEHKFTAGQLGIHLLIRQPNRFKVSSGP